MTSNEFFVIFNSYQRTNMSHSTWTSRTSLIRCHFLPEYGNRDLDSITFLDIDHIYDSMKEEHLANNTIFGCYAALNAFFKMAVNRGYIENNPVKGARKVKAYA